jgi:hypothetical protein
MCQSPRAANELLLANFAVSWSTQAVQRSAQLAQLRELRELRETLALGESSRSLARVAPICYGRSVAVAGARPASMRCGRRGSFLALPRFAWVTISRAPAT